MTNEGALCNVMNALAEEALTMTDAEVEVEAAEMGVDLAAEAENVRETLRAAVARFEAEHQQPQVISTDSAYATLLQELRKLRRRWRTEATRLAKWERENPHPQQRNTYEANIYEACANDLNRLL